MIPPLSNGVSAEGGGGGLHPRCAVAGRAARGVVLIVVGAVA